MLGILTRFCGVDATTLAEQAYAPANTLLMHGWAADAFTMFLWWLLPTEVRVRPSLPLLASVSVSAPLITHSSLALPRTRAYIQTNPNRYEVKISDPAYDISLCHPPPTHVTFLDHSRLPRGNSSRASAIGAGGVDLPARELLRAHAALALVLHGSGAKDAFGILQNVVPARYPRTSPSSSLCPGATGGAFWRSVVEYGGPEVCLEVGLWEAAHVDEGRART